MTTSVPGGWPPPPYAAPVPPGATQPMASSAQQQIRHTVGIVIVCGLMGLILGMIGTLLHRWLIGPVPVGLIIGLGTCTGMVILAGLITGSRLGAAAAACGWMVILGVLFIQSLVDTDFMGINDIVIVTNRANPYFLSTADWWLYAGPAVALAATMVPYPRLCHWAQTPQ